RSHDCGRRHPRRKARLRRHHLCPRCRTRPNRPRMTSPFTIKPASRVGIIPLIGLWGGTGGGKTKTALLLARGLAGPTGKIGIVDTEHGRANYYDKSIPGGFSHIAFDEPYSPERYLEVLELLEKSVDVGIIDSGTHLWEGPEGILDLHEQALDRMCGERADWRERESKNWPAWRDPKRRYKEVRDKILRFKIPLIICLRGEQKTRLERDASGRNTVVTDTFTSPVFDKKFIFEMHVALELVQKDGQGGFIRFTRPFAKVSHEDIRRLLPAEEKEQLGISHGEALAKWCHGRDPAPTATVSPTSAVPKLNPNPPATLKEAIAQATTSLSQTALKKELWTLTAHIHHEDPAALEQWLWDEALLDFDV